MAHVEQNLFTPIYFPTFEFENPFGIFRLSFATVSFRVNFRAIVKFRWFHNVKVFIKYEIRQSFNQGC